MFEIDKEKFGALISTLRKEKGYTQKELAQQLYVSDKAVSKWETGNSIPDTSLLIPLAELLGVSVTELLMCERMEKNAILETDTVEDIVKTAIHYGEEKTERAYQVKSRWFIFYGISLLLGAAGLFLNRREPFFESLAVLIVLCAIFGAYFCFFVKTKLPGFYDEQKVTVFYDGPFRMNMMGLKFNNRNWPHIIKVMRYWCCLSMILLPAGVFLAKSAGLTLSNAAWKWTMLAVFFSTLFIPVYIAGRKYENESEHGAGKENH